VISEGSCDTEDWSNDAENSALITGYKLHFTIYSHRQQMIYIGIIFQLKWSQLVLIGPNWF